MFRSTRRISLHAAVARERLRVASGLYYCATCADARTVHLIPDSGTWSPCGPGDDPCPDCADGIDGEWDDCPVCGLENGISPREPYRCIRCHEGGCCVSCGDVVKRLTRYGHDDLCDVCLAETHADDLAEANTELAPAPDDVHGLLGPGPLDLEGLIRELGDERIAGGAR